MSLENEGRSSPVMAMEESSQAQRKLKISYSREFLLSLSELEISKKLPSGFDASFLSEIENGSHGIQDRQRFAGSLAFQGYRRSEYGSSPPTRGDPGSYSRNTYGRWESRSSGRSDRDSDSHSDHDSDSGQRHGNPSWQSWQSPERDGLLGSGSFPRASGYASGVSAPKARTNDHYHLNKSNEPYHPPRPYKAVPYSRRDTKDSYNDETFGSTESTSEDRVEEERRRRASFELMRKEQQKALQEKQTLNPVKQKVDSVSDFPVVLDDTKEEKRLLGGSDVLDVSTTPAVSSSDPVKSTVLSQTTTSRPLVPPGFANTILEKNSGLKSLIHTHKTEVGKPEPAESLLAAHPKPIHNGSLDIERQSSQDITSSDHHQEDKITHALYMDKGEKIMSTPLSLGVSDSKHTTENHLRTSTLLDSHEPLGDSEIIEISAKESGSRVGGEFNQDNSQIILENIFGSALAMNLNSSMGPVEHVDSKPDDTWTPSSVRSSKFAQWFSEEEREPGDNFSSDRPNDLLSLIVGGDKGRSQLSHGDAAEHFPSESSHESSEHALKFMPSLSSTENAISEQLHGPSTTEATPTVLTCEDLEQAILSEYSERSSNSQPLLQGLGAAGAKSEQPSRQVDSHASKHLLSLLQGGTTLNDMMSGPQGEVDSEKIMCSEAGDIHASYEEPKEENFKGNHTLGKTLTLETLFGSAFMKELQSFEAPISVQRGSVGSSQTNVLEPHELSIPLVSNGFLSSTSNEDGPYRTSHQNDILPSNHRQEIRLDKAENWLEIDDPQMQLNSSKHEMKVNSKHGGVNESVDFQLPEEESSIAAADPLKPQKSMFMAAATSSKGGLSASGSIDLAEKLAAFGAVVKEERYPVGQEVSPFACGPYDRIEPEIPHNNLHAQASIPLSHSSQMNHGRPMFYPLDPHPTHMTSQMKFTGPESMIHHDLPANHQFATNMIRSHFPRPGAGVATYDLSAHRPLLPQMQIPGNFPQHPLHELQRGSLPHPGNQATGLIPEFNSIQGSPFGPHPPNIGGFGMAMPAPDINSGGNHSDAFQRLLEMELRAKSKQIHPVSLSHGQPMYSHELDMGFQYR